MFIVRCRNAAGTAAEVTIRDAASSSRATAEALRHFERIRPGEGWIAEFVL